MNADGGPLRIVAAKFDLPNVVVDVIRLAEAGVRRKTEVERVAESE